jgi:hypothetical protein
MLGWNNYLHGNIRRYMKKLILLLLISIFLLSSCIGYVGYRSEPYPYYYNEYYYRGYYPPGYYSGYYNHHYPHRYYWHHY